MATAQEASDTAGTSPAKATATVDDKEKSVLAIQEVRSQSPINSRLTIPETDSITILSKRSAEKLYLEPGKKEFYKYFVDKDVHQPALINRGYWIRMEAIEQAVQFHLFGGRVGERRKVVVNLGCGL